jgi:hypothetical protein
MKHSRDAVQPRSKSRRYEERLPKLTSSTEQTILTLYRIIMILVQGLSYIF